MKLLKKITHNQHVIEHATTLLGNLVTYWLKGCNFKVINQHIIDYFEKSGKTVLVTTWHCGLLPVLFFFRGHKSVVMVSQSRDGEWIEKIVSRWGYDTVRGSSGRGGRKAVREMMKYLHNGYSGGLIADGSRGPARKAQKGVIFLSRKTGLPLLPVGVYAKQSFLLPTWDRTIIPYPFSKIILTVGSPLYFSHQEDFSIQTELLTSTLNDLYKKAEKTC